MSDHRQAQPASPEGSGKKDSVRTQVLKPQRLKGFRDYLPDAMAARMAVIEVIRREAELAGFRQIATPALEYAPTLVGQGGDETDKQVYRFRDHGDRDVALRFDLTVPLARFVAEHQGELLFPFRKLQIGDVWRGENTQKGRYREFCQCDLDIIGADTAAADIEILAAFQRILSQVETGAFTQGVGNRVILSALLRRFLGITGGSVESEALIALDKLGKIGADAVAEMLAGLSAEAAEDGPRRLLTLLLAKDASGSTDLVAVRAALAADPQALAEVDRLEAVVRTVSQLATVPVDGSTGHGRIVVDLSLARGLAYYTGIVFETTLDELPGFGSISSGGRYNDLASRFTTRELPGVGGSIGLDRLIGAMEEMGRLRGHERPPVLVAVATADAQDYAFEIVFTLRRAGWAAEVALPTKLGAQFRYGDRRGCPAVVTVGTSERETRTVALKIMATGEEAKALPVTTLVAELSKRIPVGPRA